MIKRITINVDDPSKAEEKQVIQKLYETYKGTDTYLASLFSIDLYSWVCGQIDNDFPPDAYGWGIDARSEDAEKIRSLKVEVESLRGKVNDLTTENGNFSIRLDTEREMLKDRNNRVEEVYGEKARLEEIIDKKANMIDSLNSEVTILKAKLYDLIAKED